MTTKKTIEIETWAEKMLIENAKKIREIAEITTANSWSGKVQTVKNDDKLTVFTQVIHTAKSGMTRWIKAYVMIDNEPRELTGYNLPSFAKEHYKWDDSKDAWKIGGCGMDMGFALVYDMASHYGKIEAGGYDVLGEKKLDMGYSLNQRWL